MKVKLLLWVLFVFGGIFQYSLSAQQSNQLLDRGFWKSKPSLAEVNTKIREGNSPTEFTSSMFDATAYAILENNPLSTIKLLIRQGNDVNKITHDARTYIFWAAYKGDVELMEYLLAQGARTDLLDQAGYSILMFAASTGQKNKAVYELCIENGMDIRTQLDRSGRNALLAYASRMEDTDMLDYFAGFGLDIHSTDENGNGVFNYVAQNRNLDLLKTLVSKYKVDFSINTKTNENAFYFATRRSTIDDELSPLPLYQYFESLGLNPAEVTKSGRNALHNLAIRSNDLSLFKYFVDKGGDVNQIDDEGNTPLINASSRGSLQKIEFLTSLTKDINHRNKEGYSSFTRAFKYNEMDVVRFLKSKEADVKVVDQKGYNLGYHLVEATRGNLELFDEKMKFLMGTGYDPKTKQYDDSSLLHAAISKQNTEFINKLIALGIDINAKDGNSQTILHHAAMQAENSEILKFLLKSGADKKALTEFEESAYDLALENEILSSDKSSIEFLKPQGK